MSVQRVVEVEMYGLQLPPSLGLRNPDQCVRRARPAVRLVCCARAPDLSLSMRLCRQTSKWCRAFSWCLVVPIGDQLGSRRRLMSSARFFPAGLTRPNKFRPRIAVTLSPVSLDWPRSFIRMYALRTLRCIGIVLPAAYGGSLRSGLGELGGIGSQRRVGHPLLINFTRAEFRENKRAAREIAKPPVRGLVAI